MKKKLTVLFIIIISLFNSYASWPGLLSTDEIDGYFLNKRFSIVINQDSVRFFICDSACELIVKEEGDTSFHERKGSLFTLKSDWIEQREMFSFKLSEIQNDSLTFSYPIPRFVRRYIDCRPQFGLLKISKNDIDGIITPAGPPFTAGLFIIEATAFGYSAVSFWKYGDEVSGIFWPVCGGLIIAASAINAHKNPEISFLESSGGLGVLGYAAGLIILGGLNLALGDEYSRKEVYWGNVIGINASVALGFGIGVISSRIREGRNWKILKAIN